MTQLIENINLKEKIKIKAIVLFNEFGISTVSMLQIADSLSISAGNLSYHYKTKAILLHTIYEDIHKESMEITFAKDGYITLHYYEVVLLGFNQIQRKYTFFFNELVHIARVYPEVMKKYELTNIQRFKEARKIIDYYIETSRLVKEEEMINYDKIIYSIFMISTFWQSQSQVINDKEFLINKCQPIDMLWNLLIPYLTKGGLQEYHQIKKYVKPHNLN